MHSGRGKSHTLAQFVHDLHKTIISYYVCLREVRCKIEELLDLKCHLPCDLVSFFEGVTVFA